MSADERSDLKARIALARKSIAYADACEKASMHPNITPELRAKIKADCDATRATGKAMLRIRLAELEQLK